MLRLTRNSEVLNTRLLNQSFTSVLSVLKSVTSLTKTYFSCDDQSTSEWENVHGTSIDLEYP